MGGPSDVDVGHDRERLGLRFARGEADLRSVYDAHGSLVYGICRRSVGEHLAAEVTQEVFLDAWRKRQQYDPNRGSLSAWLVGIARHRVVDHVRHERRHDDRRADLAVEAPDTTVVHDELDAVIRRMLVVDAMGQLPDRPRRVIELAYVHDLTHDDIAARTGIPLGTVKSDVRRGLQRLRELLMESGTSSRSEGDAS